MRVFDCFMYFDEDVVLEARLNILNQYVDKFVIVESIYSHNGEKRKLNFNINNFHSFKDKIIYIVFDKIPDGIQSLTEDPQKNSVIKIMNAIKFENGQRNEIKKGLLNCDPNDLIIISDVDEIPNLQSINLKIAKLDIAIFKQRIFYYKFNLENKNMIWHGSRMCAYNKLISPQWLRNIKARNYPKWRIDTYFNKKKFCNLVFIDNGGWHFTYIKDAEGIKKKLQSYLHHIEYDLNPIDVNEINKIISNKKVIYDHSLDQKIVNKFSTGKMLDIVKLDTLPSYFSKNKDKLEKWICNY